ncbi:parallel beta-helix domain-containing protein [Spirosoma sp. 209]|uniref:parallel beta-helix domain-containing protein n=1 Tax=Spirosoma sp. 209 TaxID=1955701 RepID=UPI00098D5DA3|nr:parallel beta-helix domain-containing protein [Spirosoma sp. 209]
MKTLFGILIVYALLVTSAVAQPAVQKAIQKQLILSDDGATIQLDEGTFTFSGSLSLEDKKNIVIRGRGMDKTILSFKGQTDGAEGLRVSNGQNIVIEDLTIQDTKGDCIKTMNVNGITFRNVKVEWTGKPGPTNGSYGLYPVQCQNVLIERCTAIGASDAGIYVGQSKNIVVRQCEAHHNVAGIEIENSLMADVYENNAHDNTGGILVFDLPDLVQKRGGNVRVYKNTIQNNNFDNFAPKGNIVARVAAGTGMLILATNQVEIFENQIINNKSIGTGIISYYMTENPIADKAYYPYPTRISIHDNLYRRQRGYPTRKGRMGMMFRFKLKFGKDVPDILWDGITDNSYAQPATMDICLRNNTGATFANMDVANNFRTMSRDLSKHNCELKPLADAKLSLGR